MAKRTLSLLAVALLMVHATGKAQEVGPGLDPNPDDPNTRVGTRGANFLHIGIGARAMALAGAGATLQPSVFSMYWNPAGIAALDGFGAGFSYASLYADLDIGYVYAGGVLPVLGGMIGVNFGNLSSGDITRTTEEFPAGGDPVVGSVFEWSSNFVGGYYARPITDRLNVGGGLKFISEGIDGARAEWVAFDAGVTFRTGLYGIELGATAQNIGGDAEFGGSELDQLIDAGEELFPPAERDLALRFDTQDHQLPTLFRFTVNLDVMGSPESLLQTAEQRHAVDVAVDLTDATDTDLQTAIGIEYSFAQVAFLRAGKRFLNENQRTGDIRAAEEGPAGFFRRDDFRSFEDGLSFGGGLQFPALGRRVAFDYAYVNRGELENIQVVSFEFGL